MNIKVTHNGHVSGGKLTIHHRAEFLAEVVKCFEGKQIEIIVQKKRKKRSNRQNAYYWGVVAPLVRNGLRDNFGEMVTLEETHEFLKAKFNYAELVNEQTGEIDKLPKSTTRLTPSEFNEFFTEIRLWAKEWLNIDIPEPNEQVTLKFD